MNIHEYQAKDLFKQHGIPVHEGRVVESAEDTLKAAQELQNVPDCDLFVVKAQVHAGGRGKGGGVKVVKTPEEAAEAAKGILGRNLVTPQTGPEGKPVHKVLIEATAGIAKEYYASIVLDRDVAALCLIVSQAGGMEIEEVAQSEPDKIIKEHFCPSKGLSDDAALSVAKKLSDDERIQADFAKVFKGMAQIFVDVDASLIEINPLAVMDAGDVVAVDAKINIDDNGLFKHPEIAECDDPSQIDPREVEAGKHDLSYVGLDGNIGCIVNGAGLAMATMDIIKYAGGEPANFLDVGGGASKEKVAAAFKIILTDPEVKAILVNIFGGIMRCDIVAEGILAAVEELSGEGNDAISDLPLVVRLEGTNVEEGKAILEKSDLSIVTAESFEEAATKVVQAIKA